jgi:hypothetical protein
MNKKGVDWPSRLTAKQGDWVDFQSGRAQSVAAKSPLREFNNPLGHKPGGGIIVNRQIRRRASAL